MTTSRKPMVYLVGTTGYPNYGDELIAATWLKYLARILPQAEVWLDCPNPGPTEVMIGHLHPNVRFTDTFWRLCWSAPSGEPWEVASFVQHAIGNPGLAPRWVAGVELATKADIVHIIGGGYINGIWPRHIGLLAASVAAVRYSRGRAAMTGQGLWPVAEDATSLLRNLAAQFDVVDVRDEPSADLLGCSLGVTASGDDMFYGLEPSLFREEDLREFMICIQADMLDVTVPALAGFLLDTLRHWGARPERVGFVEGIPRVDREVFALVEHDLPGARFYSFSEIMSFGLPAGNGQRWLSTRFHTHLVAAAAGAHGIAVSINSSYYTNKHRSLIDRGSGWGLNEGLHIPDLPANGGFAASTLRDLQEGKAKMAKMIYGR